MGLAKRQYGYGYNDCRYYSSGSCRSGWYRWGRWVALGVIIVVFLLLLFACSCITSRRRRRRGLQPMYGTGWMAKPPQGEYANNSGYPNNNYYANQPYNGGAAPPYSPPIPNQQTGNTFNSNDGYYGHQSGIELQPPTSAYQPQRGGDPVYDAPMGPPPGKGGIIR